jgi:hypothetical protein
MQSLFTTFPPHTILRETRPVNMTSTVPSLDIFFATICYNECKPKVQVSVNPAVLLRSVAAYTKAQRVGPTGHSTRRIPSCQLLCSPAP